ncbi:MAG: dTMP kinase [Nitrososphaerota archaeon]|nr:dTMP kinase [Nitrososphaerota archaeon]
MVGISKRGALIGIEGIDAAGKRTQTTLLSSWLKSRGLTVEAASFPDYSTSIGREIHDFLHGKKAYPAEVRHMLFAANRWENKARLEGLLTRSDVCIVDRYTESNLAYGIANGLGLEWLLGLESGLPRTDLVLILDAHPAATSKRRPSTTDRYELDEAIQEQARQAYRRLAPKFGWKIIDATSGINRIHISVISEVAELLPSARPVKAQLGEKG